MLVYVKNGNSEVREIEVNGDLQLEVLQGEHYYFTGVSEYTFSLNSDNTTLNINLIDNYDNQITIELQNFIELLKLNETLSEVDNKTILGISTNEYGDELINSTINDSSIDIGEIIQSLQNLLSMDETTLAKGVIVDDLQGILGDLEASAASGELQDTPYNPSDDEEDEQNDRDEEELVDNPDSPDVQNSLFDRSRGNTVFDNDSEVDSGISNDTQPNNAPIAVDDIEHYATSEIKIENPSFEQSSLKNGKWDRDVNGWIKSGNAGDWDPKDKNFENGEVTGENVAYIQSKSSISQVLNEELKEDSLYSLNIDIGNRMDVLGGSNYTVNLYAGNQIIGTITQDDFPLEDGKFVTAVLTIDTHTLAENFNGFGEKLKIEIVNDNSGNWKSGQISVDNVNMTRTGLHMYSIDEENSIVVDVLNNDSDPEGSVLSITEIQGQAVSNNGNRVNVVDSSGDVIGIARVVDNKIEFTPAEKIKELSIGEEQVVSFKYTVSDGTTNVNANVSVNVTGLGKEDNIDIQGNFNKQTIDTGLDNDSIEVSKSINKSNIDMGEGEDILTVDKNISRSTVDMGEDNDNIEVAGSIGRSTIDMGEGDDTLEVDKNINRSNIDMGDGDDQLHITGAIGKNTQIDMGEGDDTILVGKNIKGTIDGGEGEDTLHLDMKTIRLDKLDSQIDNIEKIDLENGKNQKITLDQESVVKVTNNGNELELIGENGDVVSLKGDGWSKATDTTESQHYVNTNGASIYIDNDVTVEEIF